MNKKEFIAELLALYGDIRCYVNLLNQLGLNVGGDVKDRLDSVIMCLESSLEIRMAKLESL